MLHDTNMTIYACIVIKSVTNLAEFEEKSNMVPGKLEIA